MDATEIFKLDVRNLAAEQHKALDAHVKNIIKQVIDIIVEERYDDIKKLCNWSPAGDGYGLDNYYVNFGLNDNDIPERLRKLDIVQVCQLLKHLKTAADTGEEVDCITAVYHEY